MLKVAQDACLLSAPASSTDVRLCLPLQPVVLAHSWGDNVVRNFMRWAENEQSGWCEDHLEAYISIAGPVLGVPKAVSACLSGPAPTLSLLHYQ